MATVGDGGEATRAALIRAAEQLMALHGVEGVDLKDIQLAAGQRNRSAVNYHFKDRAGLVRAIGIKHRAAINPDRHQMLDHLERTGTITVTGLVEALVEPLARSLNDSSGRDYVVILAESVTRVGAAGLFRPDRVHVDSVQRLNSLLVELLDGPRSDRELRITQALLVFPVLLADIARSINNNATDPSEVQPRVRAAVSFLVGALTANGDRT